MGELNNPQEREIMPPDLFKHYVEVREKGWAGGMKPVMGLNLPGFWGLRYPAIKKDLMAYPLPYRYQDNWKDSAERPGNFGGFEINSLTSFKGEQITLYTYSGGLTRAGLELRELTEKGQKVGEGVVYPRLQRFLEKHASGVRFGKTVRFTFEDKLGIWVYEGEGGVTDWGWKDRERMSCKDVLVHELGGQGICFIPGF